MRKRSPETDTGSSELTPCPRYERIDELVWVKTNQLQGLIRTGEPRLRARGRYVDAIAHVSRSTSIRPDRSLA
jgi:hypothetical protein